MLVQLLDEAQTTEEFTLGLNGTPQQIQLSMKDDGTFVILSIDGKPVEVRNVPRMNLTVGQTVKFLEKSKQIIGVADEITAGPICRVSAVTPEGVEIDERGEKRLIKNPKGFSLEEGDRIVVDSTFFIITQKLQRDPAETYKLKGEPTATWDDIGGQDEAKRQVQDAIELPFQHPELFDHYGVKRCKGVLLYGPPGNGKTLIARAAASAIARLHGASGAVDSGYLYIKGPEILDKWVGNTEKTIRENFRAGRVHSMKHGYPALHVYDEADALMPQRGSRRSSDISDTIVPMFLGEMDGVDDEEMKHNPIVVLLSNRPDVLDPAVTRSGRISTHIKVERPNLDSSRLILGIHARKVPFFKEEIREQALMVVANDVFSKSRLMYRINGEHDFTLGDAVNGAMLASIVEQAKLIALHRDIEAGSRTGVSVDDFRAAVDQVFKQQRGLNHSHDLNDFAEKKGIQPSEIKVERCFGVG